MIATTRASWLLGLVLAGCGAPPPHFHVEGGFVRDPEGRAVIPHGVNLAGRNRWPPYFDYHTAEDFRRVRSEWGMSSLRLITTWAAIEPQRGRYDEAYLDAFVERVQWARDAGLLVVVDLHQDVFGEGFGGDGFPRWTCDEARYAAHVPTQPFFLNYLSPPVVACFDDFWASADLTDRYAEVWRHLAARLVAFDNVIGFDVINEPFWGSADPTPFERDTLSAFYGKVTRAVRQEAPYWIAFLEPTQAHNVGYPPAFEHFDFDDVAFAPHNYDSAAESGAGFDLTHRAMLLDKVSLFQSVATRIDAALWIGEYGGVASRPGIVDYMDAEYDGAGSVAAGSMYWEYTRDDGYGLLNPDGSEKTELIDAVARPYPDRVAGDPIAFDFDDANKTFTLRYRPRATATPTLLALPSRHYPGEVDVDCGGCRATRTELGVTIDQVPDVEELQVKVTPRP
jgi:endoglycosylceramidase